MSQIELKLTEYDTCVVVITDAFGGKHIFMDEDTLDAFKGASALDVASDAFYHHLCEALGTD